MKNYVMAEDQYSYTAKQGECLYDAGDKTEVQASNYTYVAEINAAAMKSALQQVHSQSPSLLALHTSSFMLAESRMMKSSGAQILTTLSLLLVGESKVKLSTGLLETLGVLHGVNLDISESPETVFQLQLTVFVVLQWKHLIQPFKFLVLL